MASGEAANPAPAALLEEQREYRRVHLPTPYPDPEAWEANLKAALASDPRRRENYERYQRAQRSEPVDYLPIRLDVENVSRCNFRCVMCQVSGWGPKYQRAEDMSLQDFKALVDQQYGLIEIKLHGMGEPLLGRDTFFEMIRYARSKHIWMRTNSNASLFHVRENYRKLIDSGINEIQISFDGASKETFEQIRVGSKFELVVSNCSLINDYCRGLGIDRTRMWVTVQRHNGHEILDFVQIAHQMGFRRLTFSLNLHGWGQEKWETANKSKTVEDLVTPELAQQAMKLGRRLGLDVTFWNVTSKFSAARPETACPWPFQWAYVTSDMRVVPCCMIANPDVKQMGDARDFTSVWNSPGYEEFRREHLEGRLPRPCRICYRSDSLKT